MRCCPKLLALHMQNIRPHYRDSGCRLSLNLLVLDGNNAAYPYSFLDLLPAHDPDWTFGHVQRFLPNSRRFWIHYWRAGRANTYAGKKDFLPPNCSSSSKPSSRITATIPYRRNTGNSKNEKPRTGGTSFRFAALLGFCAFESIGDRNAAVFRGLYRARDDLDAL